MKLELNDESLRVVVQQQLSAVVAKVTEEEIQKKLNEILPLKLERVSGDYIKDIIRESVENLVADALGNNSYRRTAFIHGVVKDVALAVIKEALK